MESESETIYDQFKRYFYSNTWMDNRDFVTRRTIYWEFYRSIGYGVKETRKKMQEKSKKTTLLQSIRPAIRDYVRDGIIDIQGKTGFVILKHPGDMTSKFDWRY